MSPNTQVFRYSVICFALGFLSGLWINYREPKIIHYPVEPPQQTHFHFRESKSVYLTIDGNAFRLSVDGPYEGITFIKEEWK